MTAFEPAPISIEALYQGQHPWLRALLFRRVQCSETAADLAQEAFVRLLKTQVEFNQIGKAKSYLTQLAHGLCVDHWRRLTVQQAFEEALALRPDEYHPSAEETHLLIEQLTLIKALLDKLPLNVRTTLILSQFHGLTYSQIASQLGVSDRMVKKYMSSAMVHCASLMDEA